MKSTEERVASILAKAAAKSRRRKLRIMSTIAAAAALALVASPFLLRFWSPERTAGTPPDQGTVVLAEASDDVASPGEEHGSVDELSHTEGENPDPQETPEMFTEPTMVNQGATTSTKAPESVPPTATTTTPTPTPTPTTALTPTRESLPPELAALHLQSDTQSAGVRTEIYTTKEANQQITILSATTAFPPPNATAETLQLGTLELSLATLADDKFQATFTFEGTYYSARSESLAKAAFTTFLAWYLDQATPQVTSPTSSS